MAEVSRLLKEIRPTPVLQSFIDPFYRFIDKPNMCRPAFEISDLVIIGYSYSICEECLILHPLTLYRHDHSPLPVPTVHLCDSERILEVQQKTHDKKNVIATLIEELPNLMFQAVK